MRWSPQRQTVTVAATVVYLTSCRAERFTGLGTNAVRGRT
jgi:hypothetical protein